MYIYIYTISGSNPSSLRLARRDRHCREAQSLQGDDPASWQGSESHLATWFFSGFFQCWSYPIGSMYAIYGNIYHQYTPNVSIYTSTMDPMGVWWWSFFMVFPMLFLIILNDLFLFGWWIPLISPGAHPADWHNGKSFGPIRPIDRHLDVGQNRRPRGPQMLV